MADHFSEQSEGGLKMRSTDVLATDKTQYFAQPHSIIIIIQNYCEFNTCNSLVLKPKEPAILPACCDIDVFLHC